MNLLLMIRSVVDSFSFGSFVDIFSEFSQDLLASKRVKISSVFAAAASQSEERDREVASDSEESEKLFKIHTDEPV